LDKGIVILAQNSESNYIEQAVALAMSVQKYNDIPVSLITNDEVTDGYKKYFDQIIPIAWGDMADGKEWKVENRWKIFHQTPYKETIVMDTDMLVLNNIDHLWDFYSNYDLFFTSNPITYRNEQITSNFYRKIFVENELPNIYCALYYFKKNEFAHNFFAYLEMVVKEFERFQKILCPKIQQTHVSMDVAIAMTIKLMEIEDQVTNKNSSISKFVHMKPYIQNWNNPRNKWQDLIQTVLTKDFELYVGNYKQTGIFHYTEKDFLENVDFIGRMLRSNDV
jgi:alpha-N-acetylglucosamine transferase